MKETGGCFEVGSALRADLVVFIPFSGPRSRPSGPGFRYSAPGAGSGPAPVPEPEDPYQIPGHLRPETRKCIPPANHPLSNLTKNNELRTKNVNTPLQPPLSSSFMLGRDGSPSRPFANGRASSSGGLGEPRPTQCVSLFHQSSEPLICAPCPHVTVPTCPLAGAMRPRPISSPSSPPATGTSRLAAAPPS